jgi:hypothetical protein
MNMIRKGLALPLLNPMTLLRGRHRVVAATATLLATGALAATPADSMASAYQAMSVDSNYPSADGWSVSADAQGRGYLSASLSPSAAVGTWNVSGGRSTIYAAENTTFTFAAPANTSLTHVAVISRASGLAGGDWNTLARDAGHNFFVDVPSHNGAVTVSADVSGTWAQFLLQCGGPNPCYANPNAFYQVDSALMTFNDPYAPAPSAPFGELTSASKLIGSAGIAFPASDAGSGLYRTLIHDGRPSSVAP